MERTTRLKASVRSFKWRPAVAAPLRREKRPKYQGPEEEDLPDSAMMAATEDGNWDIEARP